MSRRIGPAAEGGSHSLRDADSLERLAEVSFSQRPLTREVVIPREGCYYPSDSDGSQISKEEEFLQKYSDAIHICHFGSEERTKAWASAAGYPRWAAKMTGIATIDDFVSVTQISQIINFARKVLNIDEEDLDDFVEAVVEYQQAKGNESAIVWLIIDVWSRDKVELPTVLLQLLVSFSVANTIPLVVASAYFEASIPSFIFRYGPPGGPKFVVQKMDESVIQSKMNLTQRVFSGVLDQREVTNMICDTPERMELRNAIEFGYNGKSGFSAFMNERTTLILAGISYPRIMKFVFVFKVIPGCLWTGIDELRIRTDSAKVLSLYVCNRETSDIIELMDAPETCIRPKIELLKWIPVGKRVVVFDQPHRDLKIARRTVQRVKINWISPEPFDLIKVIFEDSWADKYGSWSDFQDLSVESLQFSGYTKATM